MINESYDILIYVPFKSENLDEKDKLWINTFQSILNISLKQLIRHKTNIYNSIENNILISNENIPENAQFILQLFLNNNFSINDLIDPGKLKGSKLINIKCSPEINDSLLQHSFTVNLYEESSNKIIDLSDHIENLKNEIWLKFLDITYEIKRNIINNKKEKKLLKGKIFVAETSSDQNYNRETIIRELEHIGYDVLPKENFPKDLNGFSEFVHDNLKQTFLSVHLIGNYYAPLIENIEISSIELQNDLFHEVASELISENKIIKRYVWIPPDVKPKSEKQKLYIESFKRNIELLKNTEIIQTPIEVYKTIVKNKAEEIVESGIIDTGLINDNESKKVYLLSNATDNVYKKIKDVLIKNNLIVLESTKKENKIDLIQEHYYNLIHCDAILLDYSIENIQWLNSKLSDIIKSPGFGRKKDFLVKSVIINTKNDPDIKLQIKDIDFIHANQSDIEAKLKNFIEKIK